MNTFKSLDLQLTVSSSLTSAQTSISRKILKFFGCFAFHKQPDSVDSFLIVIIITILSQINPLSFVLNNYIVGISFSFFIFQISFCFVLPTHSIIIAIKLESIIIVTMEAQQSQKHQSKSRRRSYFNVKNPIQKWEDFMATWKMVKFDQIINVADQPTLIAFWKKLLDQLKREQEKICILVPNEIPKVAVIQQKYKDKEDLGDNHQNGVSKIKEKEKEKEKEKNNKQQKAIDEEVKTDEKKKQQTKIIDKQNGVDRRKNDNFRNNNKNNNKKVQTLKVKLSQEVIKMAMKIIDESYQQLSYVFESLYMGNQKQLLIYRQCPYLQKYLEKYRLPKNFNQIFDQIKILTNNLFEVKVKRNIAISTFNSKDKQRYQAEFVAIQDKINNFFKTNNDYLNKIIIDFRERKKVREIMLHNIRDEVKQLLRDVAERNNTAIINKYNQCDNDQFKDVAIVKMQDHRLLQVFQPEAEEPQKIEYIYIEPEKQYEAPREMRQTIYNGINFSKQCYKYTLKLPSWGKYNTVDGIFIRSPEYHDVFELNIDITEEHNGKNIEVELIPYAYGKITYEIYTWNYVGFTKSEDKIVLFNQLRVAGKYQKKYSNKNIYFLGQSQSGLLIQEKSTNGQIKKLSANLQASCLALGNSALICDVKGDCASWGELYFEEQQQMNDKQQEEDLNIQKKIKSCLKIEAPCLILGKNNIRRVSCGYGYCLMLSTFGSIWSMGFNIFGQLGLGHFQQNSQNMQPRQVCKFTKGNSPFIVDIKATMCCASFATDDQGQLYRWGMNQVEQTPKPIVDRFGDIINYTTEGFRFKCPNPFKINNKHVPGKTQQIQAGNDFYMVRTKEGNIYGWGMSKYLGCGILKDMQENQIIDIVNPKQIMSGITYLTCFGEHSVAITKDKKILAWGNGKHFSNIHTHFYNKPMDVTEEYGNINNIKIIKAGKSFTIVVYASNLIKIFGEQGTFAKKQYQFQRNVCDIECSYEQLIGILADDVKND